MTEENLITELTANVVNLGMEVHADLLLRLLSNFQSALDKKLESVLPSTENKIYEKEFLKRSKELNGGACAKWLSADEDTIEDVLIEYYRNRFQDERLEKLWNYFIAEQNKGNGFVKVQWKALLNEENIDTAIFINRKTKKKFSFTTLPKSFKGKQNTGKTFDEYAIYVSTSTIITDNSTVVIHLSPGIFEQVVSPNGRSLTLSLRPVVEPATYTVALKIFLRKLKEHIESIERRTSSEPISSEKKEYVPAKLRLQLTGFGKEIFSSGVLNDVGRALANKDYIKYKKGISIGTIFGDTYSERYKIDWIGSTPSSNMLYFLYLAWDKYGLIKHKEGAKKYSFQSLPYYFQMKSQSIKNSKGTIDGFTKLFHAIRKTALAHEVSENNDEIAKSKINRKKRPRKKQKWMIEMDEIFEKLDASKRAYFKTAR